VPVIPSATRKLTISDFDSALDPMASACDLKPLAFIDAYGLVGTACALRVAFAADPDFPVQMPRSESMNGHLAAMGFADFLAEAGRQASATTSAAFDASSVVVPLQSAADSGGEQALSQLLWGALRDHVHPQVLETITEGVWEMVGNALEHSGSDALVMGQVYLSKRGGEAPEHDDRVQVVIGDVGQGIRASFLATGVRKPTDDREAIDLALEYLVTSVADDPGRGQGLSTTMEQVVGLGGRMVLRSGSAKVSIEAGRKHEEAVPGLPGVIVALSLPLYPG
jgi:hypothetical protein